jgi:NADPH-dependent 2,4-dienoyl-CoA reductase/sulfur reductase-like enzyme
MTLKRLDPSLEVTVIREEPHLLTRCAIPYIIGEEATVEASYKSDDMFTRVGTKLVDSKATGIDRESKTVMTEDGNVHPYDKLVLATGGTPAKPRIPGFDLAGVFTIRTASDALAIRDWMEQKAVTKAVVVGASAVGLETAAAISRKGVGVTVVEMLAHVLPLAIDADMSEEPESYLRGEGIELRMNQTAGKILGDGEVTGVELSSGERIDAQVVLLAVGVRPRLELAEAAGLESERFGLKVNRHLQTSDPDIYAGGDVIEYTDFVTGKTIGGQLRPNAVMTGRLVAKNILGYGMEFPGVINTFATKLTEISISAAGLTEEAARQEGIDAVTNKREAESKHSMIDGREPYTVKLVFDRNSKKLIGGQIVSYSECAVKQIDTIAAAIMGGMTVLDLTTIGWAGQPELSPDPGTEPLALAAEDAFYELYPLGVERKDKVTQ